MNGPANNTFSNEAQPLNKNIKLETEPDNLAEIMYFLLPHHMTETNTSHERQINLVQLKEEPLDIMNGDIEKDPLAIEETNLVKTENLKVENEVVTIDKATISGSTKHCITCKRCVNNSVNDGIINKKSSECKCAYCEVTTEENLVENISSENTLPIQKGKNLVCEYCNERIRCKCYLKKNINFHGKN
ncbi:uncharacterized protein LOC142331578 [Lycorma delicatula]|uniref:uncharacterized protein LOC142331578 n=1 Tax=Lycorma delicatula TaxID=130591 RepID=UPI003F5112E9